MTTPPDRPARFALAAFSPARLALGRVGASLPTAAMLAFDTDHALARDAVHAPFDAARLAEGLAGLGLESVMVASAAPSRPVYLRRPDLGRRLAADSAALLESAAHPACDLSITIGDGLSAAAIHANAVPLMAALLPFLRASGLSLAPVAIAREARVALGDEIAARFRARLALVLIGERPGLTSPDSLGAYLTYAPAPDTLDSARNCVSNIRAAGQKPEEAARRIAWLIDAALARGLTGVDLKDDSDTALPAPDSLVPLPR